VIAEALMIRRTAWFRPTSELPVAAATQPVDWEAVYVAQLPRIYSYFRVRCGGDRGLAEDLTAMTFEQAWRARAQYRPTRGSLPAWLFTIARHVGASYFRTRQARGETRLDGVNLASSDASPEEQLAEAADRAQLHRVVGMLPARERELVALKYGAGLTNREIARVSGLSESNVGTRLHRLVRQLRAAWEERDDDG
jgi:RNA polymerase sigma-70 factor (ECF subfamily)